MKTLAFHTPWAKACKQAGLTLVEVLASITVASVVAGGALAMYTVTTTTQRTNSLAESINGLATSTRSMFAASGNYGTVEINAALRTAGKVPTALTGTDGTINHPLGGTVTVRGNTGTFTIQVGNLSQQSCVDLITRSYPLSTNVAYGNVTTATLPVSPATANTNCPTTAGNVTFTFL